VTNFHKAELAKKKPTEPLDNSSSKSPKPTKLKFNENFKQQENSRKSDFSEDELLN
jgi:hypothetical protein